MNGACPNCPGQELQSQAHDGLPLFGCGQCGGQWTPPDTFASLYVQAVQAGSQVEPTIAPRLPRPALKESGGSARRYRPCPVCRDLMAPTNFHKSGIAIDRCRQHGVWFDDEELPRILEWLRAGGLRNRAVAQLDRQKEATQSEAQRQLILDRFQDQSDRFADTVGNVLVGLLDLFT